MISKMASFVLTFIVPTLDTGDKYTLSLTQLHRKTSQYPATMRAMELFCLDKSIDQGKWRTDSALTSAAVPACLSVVDNISNLHKSSMLIFVLSTFGGGRLYPPPKVYRTVVDDCFVKQTKLNLPSSK